MDATETLTESKPLLHQALEELEVKGLVKIIPRVGVFVREYRQVGSIAMLASFLSYNEEELDHTILNNLYEFRKLLAWNQLVQRQCIVLQKISKS